MTWTLLTADGATVASASNCQDRQVDNLTAGTYKLSVTPQTEHTGGYALQVRLPSGTRPSRFN
jgi:hypothetical protein